MRKILLVVLMSFGLGMMLTAQTVTNVNTSATFSMIQTAINAASSGDHLTVSANTFNEAVIINKSLEITGAGVGTVITNTSGIGITITANDVTLQTLTVTGCGDHGIYAGTVTGLNISNVYADGNGLTVAKRSGIALQGVTGVSVITNVSASNNKGHGLEIGNGSSGVHVVGGTFNGNGVQGDQGTGGGIIVYADAGKITNGTTIDGTTVTASNNYTAGIYIFCDATGTISTTTIGGTGSTVTLNNNGSNSGSAIGGSAVLIFGPADHTTISANANPGTRTKSGGLVVLGLSSVGANSPTATVVKNCTLTGYTDANHPAGTMTATQGGTTYVCNQEVDATVGNMINGVATGYDVEDALMHKVDNLQLGLFRGPGSTVFVTPNSGSINRGISVASSTYTVQVKEGTYNENVNVNKSITLKGDGATTIITPASGIGITITANDVTLQTLTVTGCGDHGIYAGTVTELNISNVYADGNGLTVAKRSGIALQGVTGVSVITNVSASNNKGHGLEIGNGSSGVHVVGGTFNGNGVQGDQGTGGGIIVYADAGKITNGTTIDGTTVTASNNYTAGIYIFCDATGTISTTTIGGTGSTVTLNNNGSNSGSAIGGSAVLIFGPADHTTISANANPGTRTKSGGLVVLGLSSVGANSPTATVVKNCTLTGYTDANHPAGTMTATQGGTTYVCNQEVDATVGNMINGVATGYDVEDALMHKVDNLQLGLFRGPGSTVFVTPNSGSINRGISVASSTYTVQVKEGTYNENVNVNRSITLKGDGATTIITPASGVGITVSANNVSIQELQVNQAPNHGIYAASVSGLTITNVVAYENGYGGIASGIALKAITGNSILTNITATNNSNHGIEIGNGSVGVQIDGGTFDGNGTVNNFSTGGGITLYSDLTGVENEVQNIVINGTLAASSNKTAGIYIYSDPGLVTGTSIGQTGTITLTDNGSVNGTYGAGGAGVLIYGSADASAITATFSRTTVVGSGLVALGTSPLGASSPTNTTVSNSTFTGYNNSTSPAITLANKSASPDYISNNPVDAFTGNTFTGVSTYAAIENIVFDKVDNSACGNVSIPQDISVTVSKNVEISLVTYLSMTSSVDLTDVDVLISQLIDAVNTTTTGTLVTGVSVEIPTSQGTVADEVLQISADIPISGYVEFKYLIQDRNNFHDNTRVQHFHDGVWTDLGQVVRYEYLAPAIDGGNGSNVKISLVPVSATAIYAVFSTNSTSTFAFVTPSGTSPLKYLTPTNAFQSANVNTAYPSSLVVTVTDGAGALVSGVLVTFTRPSSGASVTFTSGSPTGDIATATTDVSGIASVTVTANGTTGAFNVTANTASSSSPSTFGLTNKAVTALLVKVKVFLEGPFSSGSMITTLATDGLIPLNQSYTGLPFSYAGTETAASTSFLQTNSVVDWILVELRSTASGAAVDRRAALLKSDGNILDTDGSEGVSFATASSGSYYIVIKHRNHLAIMSAASVSLPNATAYDFTTAQAQAYGATFPTIDPMHTLIGGFGMWAADDDGAGVVDASDRAEVWNARNVIGYIDDDTDLSGKVDATDRANVWNNRNMKTQVIN